MRDCPRCGLSHLQLSSLTTCRAAPVLYDLEQVPSPVWRIARISMILSHRTHEQSLRTAVTRMRSMLECAPARMRPHASLSSWSSTWMASRAAAARHSFWCLTRAKAKSRALLHSASEQGPQRRWRWHHRHRVTGACTSSTHTHTHTRVCACTALATHRGAFEILGGATMGQGVHLRPPLSSTTET